jgi:hypothetical protein
MSDFPVVLGDEQFIKKLAGEQEPEGIQQLAISVNPQGEIIGDTSHLDPHILAQLQTPEAQKSMREQYRTSRYGVEEKREPRYLNEREDRRVFIDRKPKGVDSKAWRKACRKAIRKTGKAARKVLRRMDHGERNESQPG